MSTIDLPVIRQRIAVDSSSLDGARGKFGTFASGMGKAVVAGGAIAAAGIGAFVASGVAGARDVERGVREVVTLFGETGEAANELSAELQTGLRGVSDELGIAQDELTGGLYDAISAGIPKDNVFEFLKVAGQASVAGVTDVGTAVDGLTSTINAFGLDASQAAEVADSMFAAVQGGKTTFEELSGALYNVAPAAAAAGVDFQEVNAAIATLTAGGTPTKQATTQMRAALVGLQRPSAELDEIFQSLGYESAQVALESEGLQFALDAVSDAADGNNGKLQKLLGSSEAVSAAQVLAGTGAAKFSEEIERQQGAAGAAATAFDTMQETTDASLARLKTRFQNIAMQVGSVLLPKIADVADWIGDRLPGAIDAVKPLFDALVSAFRTGSSVAGTIASAFGSVWEAAQTLIDVVRPIVSDLIAGFASSGEAGEGLRDRIKQVVDAISKVLRAFGEVIRFIAANIARIWSIYGKQIVANIRTVFDSLMRIVRGAMRVIEGIIDTVLGVLTGDWSRAWSGIKNIVGGVWDAIVGLVRAALTGLRNLIGILFAAIGVDIESKIRGWISGAAAMVRRVVDAIRSAMGAVTRIGSDLYNAGRRIIQSLIDGVMSKVRAVRDAISSVTRTVRNFLPFSPAKEGPLSGRGAPDRAGATIGRMLADGMLASRSAIVSASGALAGAVALPTGTGFGATGTAGAGFGQGASISQTFNVEAWDVESAARRLGETQVRSMHLIPGAV